MAGNPTPGPTPTQTPAPLAPATAQTPAVSAQDLLSQLAKLEDRLTVLQQTGARFADISGKIKDARDLVDAGNLTEAQALCVKAAAATDRAEASAVAERLARKLLGVEASYLVAILALGYLVVRYPDYWLWAGLVGLNAKAAWFGAVGGVTIGIYGIYSHISAKDFDTSFRLWYICKPVVGAIFGWFVFLVYYVGVLTAVPSTGGEQLDFKNPQLAYLIAFLAGFSERFTIKTIDRLMTVLTAGDEKKKADTDKEQQSSAPPNF